MADIPPEVLEALDYEAPFLIDKLVRNRFVDTPVEARALFTELKRYLVLTHVDRTKAWKMHSVCVDEAWHQFVLFTVEYGKFCAKHFGRYRHHAPSNASGAGFGGAAGATLAEFGERYRDMFGMDLPQVWNDSSWVTPHRRIVNGRCGQLALGSVDGMVELIDSDGQAFFQGQRHRPGSAAIHCWHGCFLCTRIAGRADRRGKGRGGFRIGRNQDPPCRLTAPLGRRAITGSGQSPHSSGKLVSIQDSVDEPIAAVLGDHDRKRRTRDALVENVL